jgi:hypothetical protein
MQKNASIAVDSAIATANVMAAILLRQTTIL